MNVIAINGSLRKTWNTATLLAKALEGAARRAPKANSSTSTTLPSRVDYLLCLQDDYSKFVATRFDPKAKAERRKTVFPEDCRKAFEMGARLAKTNT